MTVSEQDRVGDNQLNERMMGNGRLSEPSPVPAPREHATFNVNGRKRRILVFFAGIISHVILLDLILGKFPLLGDSIRISRPRRWRNMSRRFRDLAVDMGGVMIKLGQFLSARVDVLPPEITEELKGLQDEVPSEPNWRIMSVLQAELGDYQNRFVEIEEEPVAAASLGQAHRAWLYPRWGTQTQNSNSGRGEAVVIKIQRPNIEKIVQTDLAALNVVAKWIQRYRPVGRRADVPALMREFAKTLEEELDYTSEADNAERFAEMYANDEQIYIPAVYREHSTGRVIVLEYVQGFNITDVDGLRRAGVDPQEVAACLLDTYFYQIFEEGFFHADPHPGNIFIWPRPEVAWVAENGSAPPLGRPFWLIFVDFGMVGYISEAMRQSLRKVLLGVMQRDASALTNAYADLGFFLPGADLARITEAQTAVLDRIWGRNLLDLAQPDPQEVRELSQQFKDLLFEFPFQVPQDFIYLGRAIGMVSGLVSQLDTEINPWHFFEKYGQKILREQEIRPFSWETAVETIKPYLTAPAQIQRLLTLAESGRLQVQTDRETIRQYERIEKRIGQLGWSILGAAGMISATLLFLNRRERGERRDKEK